MIADDLALKLSIHQHCINLIEEKINTIQKEYRLYQDSAANETKSSAGDKHDTGKAMMQMEQEKLGIQFKELVNSKKFLDRLIQAFVTKKYNLVVLLKLKPAGFIFLFHLEKFQLNLKKYLFFRVKRH